jgi:hypothetical protein
MRQTAHRAATILTAILLALVSFQSAAYCRPSSSNLTALPAQPGLPSRSAQPDAKNVFNCSFWRLECLSQSQQGVIMTRFLPSYRLVALRFFCPSLNIRKPRNQNHSALRQIFFPQYKKDDNAINAHEATRH